MKGKRVRVVVGFILVCLLTGMLGVYSASASTQIGLTYRLNDWGGLKIETQSGFGGELLFEYDGETCEHMAVTELYLQPSVLYHFKGSSDTSPYVGIGYYSDRYTYENWGSEVGTESGIVLLAGLERFFGNVSCDLRASAYFTTWKEVWDSSEDQGTYAGIYVDLGVSVFAPTKS